MATALQKVILNWRLKLAALALAVLLWIVLSADQTTARWLPVPVDVDVRDASFRVLPETVPAQVQVRFTGPGRDLFELAIQRPRLVLPIQEVEDEEQLFPLDPRLVRVPNGLTVGVQDVQPNYLRLGFERMDSRSVPVVVEVADSPAIPYVLSDTLAVRPARVRISGPAARLEGVSTVRTLPLDLARVDTTFTRAVALDTSGLRGVQLSARTVQVSGEVDRAAQRVISNIPITLPAGLRAVPATLDLVLSGPARELARIAPGVLRVEVPPAAVPDELPVDGLSLPVQVQGLPRGIRAASRPASVRVVPIPAPAGTPVSSPGELRDSVAVPPDSGI